MIKGIKKRIKQIGVLIGCFVLALTAGFATLKTTQPVVTQADTITYRTGANGAHSTYKSNKYYKHVTSIQLTGDGVTDTLAAGLSQLGYSEGSSSNFSGVSGDLGGKTTEYVYNYGDAEGNGYKMAWCASFCSWSIYQSRTANHSTHDQSCRNHIGDKTYIWRECSCAQWADQLKRFGMYKARGSYTPKSGDLIFFKYSSGSSNWTNHIGFVLWCDGSTVYTLEGNRSNKVLLDSFSLSDSLICGYGILPYPTNPDAPKVDYSGRNKTAGQYITNNATLSVSSSKGGSTSFTVGKYEMFNVTGFDGNYAVVEYNGSKGYATLSSTTIQVTASASQSVTVDQTSIQTSSFASGAGIPVSNLEHNPNVYIQGLSEEVTRYKGLENYGNNKQNILINGRTWDKWEELFGQDVLKNMWVYGVGDGDAYLGIEMGDTSKLHLKNRSGGGETLDTIVLKRGFEFVNTSSNQWDGDEISSSSATGVIGRLQDNIILVANNKGGFNVVIGDDSAMALEGYTFSSKKEEVVTLTGDANVRSGPDTSYSVLGVGLSGTSYVYLDETQNDKWLKINYNGQTGWVSSSYASLSSGSNVVEIEANNRAWTEDITYSIVDVDIYEGSATSSEKVALQFLNNENAELSSVNLGYTWDNWSKLAEDEPFFEYIKINGTPIKEAYPDAVLWVMSQGDSLSLENITVEEGDEITIEQGATFTHDNITMKTLYKFRLKFDGSTYSVTRVDVGDGNYSIIKVDVFANASHPNAERKIAFKFLDNEDEELSTVDLGYTCAHWTAPDENTTAFLGYIKINGTPIKEAYPDAVLWVMNERNGLSLENVVIEDGDEITIDKDATFTHGDVEMVMQYKFQFTFNGSSFDITKANVGDGNYTIVKVDLFASATHPSEGAEGKMAFKFLDNEDETLSTVDLGYTRAHWSPADEDTMAFLNYFKINGTPIKEAYPEAVLMAMDQGNGMSLENIEIVKGDEITIDKGATFTRGEVTMKMGYKFVFAFNGSSFDISKNNGDASLNELENKNYFVVKVTTFNQACFADKIAFKFLDHTEEAYSNLDFGYTRSHWSPPDADTMAFMQYFKVNGEPVLAQFPDAVLMAMDQGNGLSLENIQLTAGDRVSIDKGAVFTHGGVTAKMMYDFVFTYMGEDADQKYEAWTTPDYNTLPEREYSILRVDLFTSASHPSEGAEGKMAFKFLNNDDESASTVNLGYPLDSWSAPDADTTAFMKYIKINGRPVLQLHPDAVIWVMSAGNGLSLENIQLTAGDVVTIDQGAVFTHGGVSMVMQFQFVFTFEGDSFDVCRVNAPAIDVPPTDEDSAGNSYEQDEDVDGDVSEDSVQSDEIKTKGCRSMANVASAMLVLAVATLVVKKRKE